MCNSQFLFFFSLKQRFPAILIFSILENLKREGSISPPILCFSFKSAAIGCERRSKLVLHGSMGSFLSYLRVAYIRANCITKYKDRNDRRLGRLISCEESPFGRLSVCLSVCLSIRPYLSLFIRPSIHPFC